MLPLKLEDTDLWGGKDIESPKNSRQLVRTKSKKSLHSKEERKIKDMSSVLRESAITSMKESDFNEFSRGEKSFLKDLHKQLVPT